LATRPHDAAANDDHGGDDNDDGGSRGAGGVSVKQEQEQATRSMIRGFVVSWFIHSEIFNCMKLSRVFSSFCFFFRFNRSSVLAFLSRSISMGTSLMIFDA
jgi:hypothetical protein